MLRKTLTILSLIGLLLSVGLWGVSHLATDYNAFDTNLIQGYLIVVDPRAGTSYSKGLFDPELGWYAVGLHNLPDAWRSDSKVGWYIRIRLWIPSLLFAIMTLWAVAPAYRRRKRKKLGLCLKCGYDLRGSKDRCPECGEEFSR